MSGENKRRLPEWFRAPSPLAAKTRGVRSVLKRYGLNTVCQSAACPNMGGCFAAGTAAFLILGSICTRHCRFCAVPSGVPQAEDPAEPERLAAAVQAMGIAHAVVTSVTRDDLKDGGAGHFASVIYRLKQLSNVKVEVLTPDFCGDPEAIKMVVAAQPDIFNHNLETVPRLYAKIRPEADYQRSLGVLKEVKHQNVQIITKSGLMAGLGETFEEIIDVLQDLRAVGCDMVTIGQYLQPSRKHMNVAEFIRPEVFQQWADIAGKNGFSSAVMGPLVRSSYHAADSAAGLAQYTAKAGSL